MNIFVLAILVYLLYRFIAGFLIPVIRTTSHVRQQFNAQRGTHNSERPTTPNSERPTPNAHPGASKVGEYIDFEEVK